MSLRRDRPNVLLVVADQWRGMDQGWLGNRRVKTPNLDLLAADGVAIRQAMTCSPICGPSRASLLTGLLPHEHGVVANDLPLDTGLPTLATRLDEAGYRTGWIGTWHLAGMPRDKWVPPAARPGIHYWTGVDCDHQHLDGHYYDRNGARFDYAGYEPVLQSDQAVEFITTSEDDRPFFLTVCYGPPHDPYDTVPERYRYPQVAADEDGGDPLVRPNASDSPAQRETQRLYWSAMTAIDEQLGRLITVLDDHGLREDTIVVFTSDHGDMLGSHGFRAKQLPYREALHIPLLLSCPGTLTAAEPTGIFGLIDLAPTVLGLLGLPPIGSYGRDLSAALRTGGALRDRLLIGNWVSCDNGYDQGIEEWRGFVTSELSYARTVDGRPWMCFDDRADPWQLYNLVDASGAEERIAAADAELAVLLEEVGDKFLTAEQLLITLQQVQAWNAREIALRGDRARLLADATPSQYRP